MKYLPPSVRAVLAIGLFQAAVFAKPAKVLNLYGFGDRPHGSAQQPVVAFLDELSAEHGFEVTHSKNSDAVMTIDDYDVVVFNSTAFGAFTKAAEREKIEAWMAGGGKAIGFHSACDTRNYKWPFWQDVLCSGATYDNDFFDAFTLEADAEIENLPGFKAMWMDHALGNETEIPNTELYVYNINPRGKAGVTMFHTVGADFSEIPDHPFGWHRTIGDKGGEFIYSALGHQQSDFSTGWVKKATWAWMQYLTGEYDVSDVNGNNYRPFARIEMGKNSVHIKDNGRHSVRIFDPQGRLRFRWSGSGEKTHEFQGLEKGIYYLQVKSEHLDHTRPVTIH